MHSFFKKYVNFKNIQNDSKYIKFLFNKYSRMFPMTTFIVTAQAGFKKKMGLLVSQIKYIYRLFTQQFPCSAPFLHG